MKKYLILLAMVVMAGGVYSFSTTHQKSATLTQKWYDFVGEDPDDPLDYQVHSGPAPTCNSGSNRCAVKATQDTGIPGGDYPNLSDPSMEVRNKP